jgi:hypothetical protein
MSHYHAFSGVSLGEARHFNAERMSLSACSKDEETAGEAGKEVEPSAEEENEAEENEIEENEAAEAEGETGDEAQEESAAVDGLGDLEVQLTGEATIDEEQISIEGESNLLPGSRVFSSGVQMPAWLRLLFRIRQL